MSLRDLLARMPTDCVALLRVDLREGAVTESCGDDVSAGTVARVMRELVAPQHEETILLSDDRTFVSRRFDAQHAITAICRGTRSLGLVVSLLREELA